MGKLTEAEKARLPAGMDLIREVIRRHGPRTLQPFSCGKDSIACALAIRDHIDIVPMYYVTVPGLEFVEESLDYYERKLFHRHILRMPHPMLYNHWDELMFQAPGTAEVLAAATFDLIDFPDVNMMAIEKEGMREDALAALGVRANDSQLRRASFYKFGSIRETRKSWFPIWDWSKQQLTDTIVHAGLSLPIDYLIWGRSWDGFGYQYMVPMKKYLPRDYAKIVEMFPLIDAEVWRYEAHQQAH